MKLSVCIPARDRTPNLREVMPSVLAAARYSPPVEVCILDYGSTDGLAAYIAELDAPEVAYRRYDAPWYHNAHARNLAHTMATGDWQVASGTDIGFAPPFFAEVRAVIASGVDVVGVGGHDYPGVVAVRRDDFYAAGGYDERLEFYGKEDKDLLLRLERRGLTFGYVPSGLLWIIPTPNGEKTKNYRLNLGKHGMEKHSKAIYEENIERGVLVANEGVPWGQA